MTSVARIVTRLQGEGDGLFLGALMGVGRRVFKPNTIYEVFEELGSLGIREVGQAAGAGSNNCLSNSMSEGKTLFHWGSEISHILESYGKLIFMTADELRELEKEENESQG